MQASVLSLLIAVIAALSVQPMSAQIDSAPPVPIVDDEGGVVRLRGEMVISNPLVIDRSPQPLVLLEDQAGFVERNRRFVFPLASQTLGQFSFPLTTDQPIPYTLALPIEPQGTLVDVDNDDEVDTGVQVFAAAFWSNTWGAPFIEQREQGGYGWSSAYASMLVTNDPNRYLEVTGGRYLLYAPDDQQGFPTGFGADGLLFTDDDPIGTLPQGYTAVDLDTDPFTFSRRNTETFDLLEPESIRIDDFSDMTYTEAYNALIDLAANEYAFTDYYGIDWEALRARFAGRVADAEAAGDLDAYLNALEDLAAAVQDGHVSVSPQSRLLSEAFDALTSGGIGAALRQLDDGRFIIAYLNTSEPSPAADAGMAVGAEIVAIDGEPTASAVNNTRIFTNQSSEFARQLQRVRYSLRRASGSDITLTFRNPGATTDETVTLTAIDERESFAATSFYRGFDPFAAPVTYEVRAPGYAYVTIKDFESNELLMIQEWENFLRLANQLQLPGIVIDMRQNGGGNPYLANQMAAYFFDEEIAVGNDGSYSDETGEFYFDPQTTRRLFPPPEEALRWRGDVAILIGPACASACESFAYAFTFRDAADTALVGQYPTAGLGGGIRDIYLPDGVTFRLTVARNVDNAGDIHIEGKGVAPTVDVPVTVESETTILNETGDPVLDAALEWLGL